jgi:hypothetical protein
MRRLSVIACNRIRGVYLLEDVRCGFQIVGELAYLTNTKALEKFAALGDEFLMARQPYFSSHFSLFNKSLEVFYIHEKA